MFHHLHDGKKHIKSQGSITSDELHKLIKNLNKKKLLDPDVFIEKIKDKSLQKDEICLSFDDGLKSQVDIAAPVLEDHKVKAFFFVYTNFETSRINIEALRYFREKYFNSIDEYYCEFFKIYEDISHKKKSKLVSKYKNHIKNYSQKFKFYSLDDILYRKIRDTKSSEEQFIKVNKMLFKLKKFNYKKSIHNFYMGKKDYKMLNVLGHNIGLHSHTHPTNLNLLEFEKQFDEFYKNKSILEEVLKKDINSASYPCGNYDLKTKKILKKLNIEFAFIQIQKNNFKISNLNKFEIPRIDHTYLKGLMV